MPLPLEFVAWYLPVVLAAFYFGKSNHSANTSAILLTVVAAVVAVAASIVRNAQTGHVGPFLLTIDLLLAAIAGTYLVVIFFVGLSRALERGLARIGS